MTVIVIKDWYQYKTGLKIENAFFEDGYCCWYTSAFTQAYIPETHVRDIKEPIQLKLF